MKTNEKAIITKNYCGVKFEVIIDNRYARRDGTFKVALRIYHGGKYAYINTGVYAATPADIDKDNYSALENLMNRTFQKCRPYIDEDIFTVKSVDGIIGGMEKKDVKTINELIERRLERMEKDGKFGTLQTWRGFATSFNKAMGQMCLKDVNAVTMHKYAEYLKNNYSQTTQTFYLNDLKAVINEAIYNKYLKESQNPFKVSRYDCDPNKIIVPKSAKRTDRYLTHDEIRRIWKYNQENPDYYVSAFLMSYLMGGINIADLVNITFDSHYWNTNQKEIAFTRQKTAEKNDFTVRLAITDKIRELFNIMGVTVTTNAKILSKEAEKPSKNYHARDLRINSLIKYHIQLVCKAIGIQKNVSATWARHSFATIANRLQLPFAWIEYTMGHANNNISSHYMGGYTTEQLHEFSNQLL